ncbi:MAG: HepT-like ribonuclease domain-containing protein [Dermatophilaceae bacterium]
MPTVRGALQLRGVRVHGLRRGPAEPRVIGEAVRALPTETRDSMPQIPWPSIAGMRNIVIHEYFRIDKALIHDIVDTQLQELATALDEA